MRQYLFEGYEDTILTIGNLVPPGILPIIIPFDKFGWVYTVRYTCTLSEFYKNTGNFSLNSIFNPANFPDLFPEKWFCGVRWTI